MDVRIDESSGAYGTFTMNGSRLYFLATRSTEYFKASAAFYISQGASRQDARSLDHRWVKPSTASAEARFFLRFTSVAYLFSSMFKPAGAVKLSGIHTIDGMPTVVLTNNTGARMHVAAKGDPVPLEEVSSPHRGAGGWIRFDDYNKPVRLPVPKNVIHDGR